MMATHLTDSLNHGEAAGGLGHSRVHEMYADAVCVFLPTSRLLGILVDSNSLFSLPQRCECQCWTRSWLMRFVLRFVSERWQVNCFCGASAPLLDRKPKSWTAEYTCQDASGVSGSLLPVCVDNGSLRVIAEHHAAASRAEMETSPHLLSLVIVHHRLAKPLVASTGLPRLNLPEYFATDLPSQCTRFVPRRPVLRIVTRALHILPPLLLRRSEASVHPPGVI